MTATGYIQIHTFTGTAQIPLKDVAITITNDEGNAIAMRLTNSSGLLDEPIEISVPSKTASLTPGTGIVPFTAVDLYARLENYEEIYVTGIQVFPQTITLQNLEMIPLAEFPLKWNKTETFKTPAQNL